MKLKASYRYWCNNSGLVEYDQSDISTEQGQWALLHEIGHAVLGHSGGVTDTENLVCERAAWDWAAARTDNPEGCRAFAAECLATYTRRQQCSACGSTNTQEWASGCWVCQDCYTDY